MLKIYDTEGADPVRELVQKDCSPSEQKAFEAIKAQLQAEYAAPEGEYIHLTAQEVIKRNTFG